jgi:methyltransferase (TIGR00027 family)
MPDHAESKYLISLTAHLTAAARAYESEREDRLFNDPWAAALAGSEGEARFAQIEDNGGSIIVRTRFFDEFLLRATNEEGIRQIVMPACGLDTRAFRLTWPPETRFFELDQPAVLRYKQEVLERQGARPTCERLALPVDLTEPAWTESLLDAGYDPTAPAVWLVEGLLFYLPVEEIERLLTRISSLTAPRSQIGFDAVHSAMIASPRTGQRIRRVAGLGAPWIGSIDDPEGLLGSLGWKATFVTSAEKGREYQRAVFPFLPIEEWTPETLKLYHRLVTAYRL